jgi:hypothetical protein
MGLTSIKFALGLYPKTNAIEQKRLALQKQFDEFNAYASGAELARYQELDKFVNSTEFAQQKTHYQNLVYKGSVEEQKEFEYLRLKKWHEVKFYYKYKASSDFELFRKMDSSSEIAHFEELKSYIESDTFKKVKDEMTDKHRWDKTDEYRKWQEYQSMKATSGFKSYFAFQKLGGYADFKALYKSAEVEDYHKLEKVIESSEFQKEKSSMSKADFEKTELFQQWKKYENVRKSSHFKHYLNLVKNPHFNDYKKLSGSPELEYYKELEAFVTSEKYHQRKKEVEKQRFEDTPEYRKWAEFKKLEASPNVKAYYKIKNSEKLSQFKSLNGGKMIADYEELEKEINSQTFIERKKYLLDTKKWGKTEEYKQWMEYQELKKSPRLLSYLKLKNANLFSELQTWSQVFEEDFTSNQLDRSKWMTRYFWGEVLLKDTYALPGERHLYTDGQNVTISSSIASIQTKAQKISGKEWNPALGFYPREFDYTSGLISTASSFRSKYGRVEAKIKVSNQAGIMHAFCLACDTMLPQIDVFKCANGKIYFSTYHGNAAIEGGLKTDTVSMSASRLAGDYFIYTLEWSPEKIEWRINGLVVKTQTENIPDEAMYVVFNSGVIADNAQVPGQMHIDWVRFYQSH